MRQSYLKILWNGIESMDTLEFSACFLQSENRWHTKYGKDGNERQSVFSVRRIKIQLSTSSNFIFLRRNTIRANTRGNDRENQ